MSNIRVSGVGTQQEVLGRAGKESPSAAKSNDQIGKNASSCQPGECVRTATKVHVPENDPSCDTPPLPSGNFGVIS